MLMLYLIRCQDFFYDYLIFVNPKLWWSLISQKILIYGLKNRAINKSQANNVSMCLQHVLNSDRHSQVLMYRIRDFYFTERLYILRCLKQILSFGVDSEHPYKVCSIKCSGPFSSHFWGLRRAKCKKISVLSYMY